MAKAPSGPADRPTAHGFSWRRASRCAASGCVIVAPTGDGVAVGDSKRADGPVLMFDREEFRAFVDGVKAGEFDDLVE